MLSRSLKGGCREHGTSNCRSCRKKILQEKFDKVTVNSTSLTKKRKESKMSKGELEVANSLKELEIDFEREKSFIGLYNSTGRTLLYYDFWIPRYKLCIEFDGSQHYASTKKESEKINDFKKNMYCKRNEMFLLRIKYTEIENTKKLIESKIEHIKQKQNSFF